MDSREEIIRFWFDMWLQKKDLGILDIFSANVQYIESWGPQYSGAAKVKHWFDVSAISKCRFSPKWDVDFYRAAYRCYTALYTTSLAGLKPVKP